MIPTLEGYIPINVMPQNDHNWRIALVNIDGIYYAEAHYRTDYSRMIGFTDGQPTPYPVRITYGRKTS